MENLTCPITKYIFDNPYITPEGQTFDKIQIQQVIHLTHTNPITKTSLEENELRLNEKILELSKLYKNFDNNTLKMIDTLLKKNNGEFYRNPIVKETGKTIEGEPFEKNYKNLILKSIIEQIGDILNEDFNEINNILYDDYLSDRNISFLKYDQNSEENRIK